MKNFFGTLILTVLISLSTQAQDVEQSGEFGVSFGGAHYFGDLNTRASINRPKFAGGIFFRKQFNNYLAARLSGHYAQLGYSDTYSKNEFQRLRNLSFNTDIFEVALQGDFNFFKYLPSNPSYNFTPYVTLGLGLFSYDPYAYLGGRKVSLRDLGTEGQTIGYMGRKPYSTLAVCVPFGAGLKYSLTQNANFHIEVVHRFTFTDYIDDVSTTYIGINRFQPGPPDAAGNPTRSPVQLLQDRSYEIDNKNPLGMEGRQRGFSKQKDQYIFAEIGISFNISTYKCPAPNL